MGAEPSRKPDTVSSWPFEMSGPISVVSRRGSPTVTPLTAVSKQLHEPVEGRPLDEDARAGAAVLAGVVEDPVGGGGRGLLQVGVGEDDVGALAAELQGDRLHLLRAARHDPLAHLGAAGEDDLADVGVVDEALADDRPLARHDLEHALGDAGLERELAEADRGERRELGRLEDDGAAGRERGREAPAGDRHGEVPRHDDADDADRLLERDVDAARAPGSAGRTAARARPRSSRARWRRCPPPSGRCRWCGRRWPPRAGPAPRRAPGRRRRTGAASPRGRPAPRRARPGRAAWARAIAASVSSSDGGRNRGDDLLGRRVDDVVHGRLLGGDGRAVDVARTN